eukprot:scpid61150/ scgid13092/ Beta-secretase 2; Aspartic-like protease 56 kDa; Aspartyl protease 1; Beta-site amyloid precursor protein cleaving enzyme 2; Down region aspartic protease; Memapsin-1; Membrane-associated aspartic protease 1; Theta-secretase
MRPCSVSRGTFVWCSLVLLMSSSSSDCQNPIVSDLSGYPGRGYSLEIGLGTPEQKLRVILDTGSSNFAVAGKAHKYLSTFFNASLSTSYNGAGSRVSVTYTEGYWEGDLAHDRLSISQFTPLIVQLEAIDASQDFFVQGADWQGILGLAYASLAKPSSAVTPVFDSLVSTGTVSSNMFSMQLCGTVDTARALDISTGGKFVLDGISPSLFSGEILYTPLVRTGYYEVVMNQVSVNGQDLDYPCVEYNTPRTIVDSGTTGLRFPTKIYNQIVAILREYAVNNIDGNLRKCPQTDGFWKSTDACCIQPSQSDALFRGFPNITISMSDDSDAFKEFKLVIPSQLYLQAELSAKGLLDCYKFFVLPSEYGSVLGAVLMEGYYVVFDRQNKRIGFAKSTCEVRDANFQKPAVVQSAPVKSNASCIHATQPAKSSNSQVIAVAAGVSIGVIVVVFVSVLCFNRKCCSGNADRYDTQGGDEDGRGATDSQLAEYTNSKHLLEDSDS